MRVAVWEYFCASDCVPAESGRREIQREGQAMLLALVEDLLAVSESVDVLWDPTLDDFPLPAAQVHRPRCHDLEAVAAKVARKADLAVVIAPESDHILRDFYELVTSNDGVWRGVEPGAIAIASDKLKTHHALSDSGVATALTLPMSDAELMPVGPAVLKPIMGAGCEDTVVVTDTKDLDGFSVWKETHVLQPLVSGMPSSMAGIGHDGVWTALPVVRQIIVGDELLEYAGGLLDIKDAQVPAHLNEFVQGCADAIGAMNGWLGIDFIEKSDGTCVIIDVNPRLTTSYIGYRQATTCNLADAIVRPSQHDFVWKPGRYTFTKQGDYKVLPPN